MAVRDDGLALDPASGPYPAVSQLFYATCAKLLNYPDAAGAAGQRLRPDAAAAMPALSNGGRTYTFRIRRGMRFSPPSGAPLDARAFKHTLRARALAGCGAAAGGAQHVRRRGRRSRPSTPAGPRA